tara:strand:- start:1914 stop:2351 length:438 start_codon:yes stop_codon:yes gene_type:complete
MSAKVYQVTIRAVVVTSDLDPVSWGFEALTDHLTATPQLIAEVTSELLVPEVKAPPVAAPKVVQVSDHEPIEYSAYINGRPCRTRKDAAEIEYCYRSHDYISFSKRLEVGTRTTREKKPCVWLTTEEAELICLAIREHRALRGGE